FGFVDVPGHERFVRNMLAGVSGIDLPILVIAADEGIKPQTREHFDICRLLSLKRGITVLTKVDLVDEETLEVVQLEVQDFLRHSFLESSPILPVSSLTGQGLDELRRQLIDTARKVPAKDSGAITRLPIDRVFTMKGFGTVVTGTLVAGTIEKDQELEFFPSARRVRTRGVEVHGSAANGAVAGERTAVNLAGVNKQDLERGMMLTTPGVLEGSSRLDVRLSLLGSARAIKTGSRVHLHAFSAETIATVTLLEGKRLEPGAEAFAQLRTQHPQLLLPGDRFIIRQFSPVVTIGGGMVLDAMPVLKMASEARLNFLKAQSAPETESALLSRIERRGPRGATRDQLIAESGQPAERVERALGTLLAKRAIARHGDLVIERARLEQSLEQLDRLLADFHRQNPLVPGLSKESLREQMRIAPAALEAALSIGLGGARLDVKGDLVWRRGAGVVMKDEEAQSRKVIEEAFLAAGLKVPALAEVLGELKIDKLRAQKIVTLLLREKVLIKVSDDLVFHRHALDGLRSRLADLRGRSPKIDVAGFKTLAGVSRKYAIPLLEYLDRELVTRRVGDERMIL
ncbi:MAG: selenocysteine-specific translation elongation factor, partial [Acidobacteria bacterium]|nr:selenocysteine-specific translation elongation factor [Acidobacteriota bacterium]